MKGRLAVLSLIVGCLSLVVAGPARAGKPVRETAPSIAIASPGTGATVSGTFSLTGTAADNTSVAKVEVKVDGGAYQLASGTTTWHGSINSAAFMDGAHTVAARATDTAGSTKVTSESLTFSNTPPPPAAPAPSPTPSPDTTAPNVAIASPAPSATLSGTVNVGGTASDDVGLSTVEVAVDGAPWSLAGGTSAWTWAWNTTTVADGQHTIAARATDTSGNVTTTTQVDAVQNGTSSSSLPAGVKEQLITPEGATIQIYSDVTGWTAQQIYELLRPNAYQLDMIGPALKIKVQTTTASSTSASATQSGGVYSGYKATIYLQAKAGSAFSYHPEGILTHEYGHAWSLYHLYTTRGGDWSSYLSARGIAGDPRVDSSYGWSKTEMIADDYRMLFGTATAVAQLGYINPDAGDPRAVVGLHDFLARSW